MSLMRVSATNDVPEKDSHTSWQDWSQSVTSIVRRVFSFGIVFSIESFLSVSTQDSSHASRSCGLDRFIATAGAG